MSVEFWTDEDGIRYVSCDMLVVGDYGGAGDIGEANIRAIERDYPEAITRHWPHSTRQLFLPHSEETEEICRSLEEDYPLYDEEEHSKVEMEWEEEAWESYLRSDLIRACWDWTTAMRDWANELPNDQLWNIYRSCMEATNTYPVMEHNGAYIDIDRIKDEFTMEIETLAIDRAKELSQGKMADDCPLPILADWLTDNAPVDDAEWMLLADVLREMEPQETSAD